MTIIILGIIMGIFIGYRIGKKDAELKYKETEVFKTLDRIEKKVKEE
jgi:hypothetical protein